MVEVAVHNRFDFFLKLNAEKYLFKYENLMEQELAPYLAAPMANMWRACAVRRGTYKRLCTRYWSIASARTVNTHVDSGSARLLMLKTFHKTK